MSKFEYLSVLVSIVIGLGISHLLSSAARLIQLRHRARLYLPTFLLMVVLFLANVQIWWVAFERRETGEWNFFLFLLYLLIPITAVVLSYLVVPDLEGESGVDLKASYYENRTWFFLLLALLPAVSMVEEAVRDGGLGWEADTVFRMVFLAAALVAALVRSERYHVLNSVFMLGFFCAYVTVLFLRLV
ncbi:MAG TPA: hypothetical protein VHG51_09180 [Longimicrobiaceae bacterium]|nr:hypothetical protein [Longimicrobiaceae bacterium]